MVRALLPALSCRREDQGYAFVSAQLQMRIAETHRGPLQTRRGDFEKRRPACSLTLLSRLRLSATVQSKTYNAFLASRSSHGATQEERRTNKSRLGRHHSRTGAYGPKTRSWHFKASIKGSAPRRASPASRRPLGKQEVAYLARNVCKSPRSPAREKYARELA